MHYYTWYPVNLAGLLPLTAGPTLPDGTAVRMVDVAWSNLLLFDQATGIQSGFYDPNEQVLYRHYEEYDVEEERYDWAYEPYPEATHFMVITFPSLDGTHSSESLLRAIPSWLMQAERLTCN
ncbi:hypothetical protein J2I47_07960 [Fibrella sp. HMF5335]|uniref:Uncharacterized protein n=1 Tax=Fibrella rubiginis TaxID=2817060 RepID=A0A939K2M6_9BACT|nr:hypothetical protein [Fibrella rubiginis]MBO0936474.1 hypothetical protein [Fibrella rubiginis]